ncbi:MAG: hypothetical protein D6770_08825 [Anaerolineae bacterium]|nr:MAG: hypothetical protein D6770_08825 [Anaerolineae bacterium]
MSTIMVTNMPFWAERIGVPRALAVEFPFAHPLGLPHDRDFQMRVIRQALDVLEKAQGPGTIVHSEEKWPTSHEEALRLSHPEEPSPISKVMGRYMRQFLRGARRGSRQ